VQAALAADEQVDLVPLPYPSRNSTLLQARKGATFGRTDRTRPRPSASCGNREVWKAKGAGRVADVDAALRRL
jgi:hypothetical protein